VVIYGKTQSKATFSSSLKSKEGKKGPSFDAQGSSRSSFIEEGSSRSSQQKVRDN